MACPPGSSCRLSMAPLRSARTTALRTTRCRAIAPPAPVVTPGDVKRRQAGTTDDEEAKSVPQAELRRYLDGYVSQPLERAYEVAAEDIEGSIPVELKGTLLRNGPANFDIGDSKITHMFDGDGLISSFAFENGSVTARRRYVRTKAFVEEMAAGKVMSKGVFTVGSPDGIWTSPFDFSIRQTANTGVVEWAGRIFALYEGDMPYELDTALRTLGTTDLNCLSAEELVAAHYRITEEADGSKRLLLLVPTRKLMDAELTVLEFDEAGHLVSKAAHAVPGGAFGFYHDFVATDNYYVFLENPMALDLWKVASKYTLGQACLAECLHMVDGKPQKVHVVPRPGKGGRQARVHESAAKFSFHHVNAFEAADGAIVVDTLARTHMDFGVDLVNADVETMYKDPKDLTSLRRLVLREGHVTATEHDLRSCSKLNRMIEFPAQLPPSRTGRPVNMFFATTSRDIPNGEGGIPQCIAKIGLHASNGVDGPLDTEAITMEKYYPGDMRYCEESVFVPREGAAAEDDGYVLVLVHDRSDPLHNTTKLEILDGRDLAAGPLAAIRLRGAVAPGLHGSWSSQVMKALPGEQMPHSNDIRVSL